MESAHQCEAVGFRRRLDSLTFKNCQHESIDGITNPFRILYSRRGMSGDLLK
jgi:hypothetical protein